MGITATAQFQTRIGGSIWMTNGSNTLVNQGNWLLSGSSSEFEVFVTETSGILSSGPINSWVNMGTDLAWTRNRAAVGTIEATAQFTVRRVSNLATVATFTVTFTAERIA